MPEIDQAELQDRKKSLPAKARNPEDMTGRELVAAVKAARGSMPLAASKLDVSIVKLDRALLLSREAKSIVSFIKRKKNKGGWQHEWYDVSLEQVEEDVRRKAALYRSEALDVLLQIAMQPLSENIYANQVKMQAAMKLVDLPGVKVDPKTGDEIAVTLKLLNDDFQKNQPRLRLIRETVREAVFDLGSVVEPEAVVRLPD
jgi:hypothetical protein